jgi:hypothetical protein
VWIRLAQIGADFFKLVFGAKRGEIGDLRLEGTGQVGGGVNDGLAELHDRIRLAGQVRREARQVRVEADTQQRIVAGPCSRQFLNESHVEPLVSEYLQTHYCTRRHAVPCPSGLQEHQLRRVSGIF